MYYVYIEKAHNEGPFVNIYRSSYSTVELKALFTKHKLLNFAV
jgi:hypothetical protein